MLAERRVLLRLQRLVHGAVDYRYQLRAPAQRIHGAALDQRLDHPLVEQVQIDLLAELEDRLERACIFARLHD